MQRNRTIVDWNTNLLIRTDIVGQRHDGSASGGISAVDTVETARGRILKQAERGHCLNGARAEEQRPARDKEKRAEPWRHARN